MATGFSSLINASRSTRTARSPSHRRDVPRMNRRTFLTSIGVDLLAAPLVAPAQQPPGKTARIGFLFFVSSPFLYEEFRQGLRELGYVEGRNIAIEYRSAEGKYDRLPGLAAELVRLKVDVIVTASPPATDAAKQATSTIPIIFAVSGDPVAAGLVASLARPGGNITGLASIAPEMVGKQLELLKEVVPKVSRVAVLQNPSNHSHPPALRPAEAAARALGVQLHIVQARTPPRGRCGFRGDAEPARGRRSRPAGRAVPCAANPARGPRRQEPAPGSVRAQGGGGGGWAHGLWSERSSDVPARRHLRGQDSQGRQARGTPSRTTDQVRAGDQPQDRQDARPHDPAVAAEARGSDH